jgi:hypothetical protein
MNSFEASGIYGWIERNLSSTTIQKIADFRHAVFHDRRPFVQTLYTAKYSVAF